MLQNIFCGRVVVGLGDAKSNVNVYHFSEDYEGPDVRVPSWSIEPARGPGPGQGSSSS